jgi:exodeoxyribonuclease VII small subunit
MSTPDDASTTDRPLDYEAARDELIDVVKQLEGGGLTLERSIALWERGEELAAICQTWLDGARTRLEAAGPEQGTGDDQG